VSTGHGCGSKSGVVCKSLRASVWESLKWVHCAPLPSPPYQCSRLCLPSPHAQGWGMIWSRRYGRGGLISAR
jgi:hypothetical protein